MPVLDLRDISAQHDKYHASQVIRTVIAWPYDEVARRRYMATLMASHLAEIQETAKHLPDPSKVEGWVETIKAVHMWEDLKTAEAVFTRWFEENGGFESIVDADSFQTYVVQMTKSAKDHFSAGIILCLIRRMAAHHADLPGGASVNKAVFIIENDKMFNGLVHRNSNDLRRAWSTYKPVAHLCASTFDIFAETVVQYQKPEMIEAVMNGKLIDELPDFLMRAAAYQKFGLSYIPPRAKETLLNLDDVWLLPEKRQWPENDYAPMPLDEAFLTLAHSYRAPIPAS
ncbi:MAG: hypothetical protein PHD48_05240 [Alphaproteobacteria bacterium]|nr:hypothetical protein [Alphaproteobacteria bacterium]